MEIKQTSSRREIGLAILLVSLVIVAISMGFLLSLTLQSVEQVGPVEKMGMIRLAWASLFSMAVVLVLLLWALIRLIALRTDSHHSKSTDYVDAWSLAGQRAKPASPEELDEAQQDSDQGEGKDDGNGEDTGPGSR